MRFLFQGIFCVVLFFISSFAFSATLLLLNEQSPRVLQAFTLTHTSSAVQAPVLKDTATHLGRMHQKHVRFIQQYRGLKVYDAAGVAHFNNMPMALAETDFTHLLQIQPPSSMDGQVYEGVDADLAALPVFKPTARDLNKALSAAMQYDESTRKTKSIYTEKAVEPIVYVNAKTQKARYGYLASFIALPSSKGKDPARMQMVVDASDLSVYESQNRLMTEAHFVPLQMGAGGLGGNEKMGRLSYDGLPLDKHYASFYILRDAGAGVCALQNQDVIVKNFHTDTVVNFNCQKQDEGHNHLYWDDALGKVNGGYSPENDAIFAGSMIKAMYRQWYGLEPVINLDGSPMALVMRMHFEWDNAAWEGNAMIFGDGIDLFYPLTSLGITAHEISHGFTEQNSNLNYVNQSGAMNEAFSDMAAKAAEVYAYGHVVNWSIGEEVMKRRGVALRYMDKPSRDCEWHAPSESCSIDDTSEYTADLNVHFASGVYNRAFYLLANSPGWDVRKAFGVMVNANRNYWTPHATYATGACGVLKSANELGDDLDAVKLAFQTVGVSLTNCRV